MKVCPDFVHCFTVELKYDSICAEKDGYIDYLLAIKKLFINFQCFSSENN
jgi:hypothetical protein